MSSSNPSAPSTRPRGRIQIQAALISSTLELLETYGLEVSIRQIAEHADVPHSVIGRYFGSKDELIRSAIDSTMPADRAVADQFESAEQLAGAAFDSIFERPERVRILIQLLQAGMSPREIRSEAPLIDAMVERFTAKPVTHADPRVVAATISALSIGWMMTEDWGIDHAGLDTSDRMEIRAQVRDLMLRLL
jgi:AcrR family transcriptional regulator